MSRIFKVKRLFATYLVNMVIILSFCFVFFIFKKRLLDRSQFLSFNLKRSTSRFFHDQHITSVTNCIPLVLRSPTVDNKNARHLCRAGVWFVHSEQTVETCRCNMVNYVEKVQLPLLIFILRTLLTKTQQFFGLVSRTQSGSAHYILEV